MSLSKPNYISWQLSKYLPADEDHEMWLKAPDKASKWNLCVMFILSVEDSEQKHVVLVYFLLPNTNKE